MWLQVQQSPPKRLPQCIHLETRQSLGTPVSDEVKSLLRDVRDALYVDQPFLDISIKDEAVVVEGVYLLLAKLPAYRDRGPLAEHRIRIEVPADYPLTEPKVTMLDDSFLSQLLRQKGEAWPFDEWDHGADGWIDAVAEFMGCRARKTEVQNVLTQRISDDLLDMDAPCPCGTGLTATRCCGISLEKFWSQVSQETAETWLRRLIDLTPMPSPREIQKRIHRNRPFRRVH